MPGSTNRQAVPSREAGGRVSVHCDGYFYDAILSKVFLKLVIDGSGTSFLDGTQKDLLVIE